MLELWLFRHGQTAYNRDGRLQGQLDVPLDERGREQANQASSSIRAVHFDQLFASDLCRAVETASILFPDHQPTLDARLREGHLGVLEGALLATLRPDESAALSAWRHGVGDARPGGGESSAELTRRMRAWCANLPVAGRVAAVTHGGAIRALLHDLPATRGRPISMANLHVTVLSLSERGMSVLQLDVPTHQAAALARTLPSQTDAT